MAKRLLEKLGYQPQRVGLVLNRPSSLDAELALVRNGDRPEWLLGFCARAADVEPVAEALLVYYRPGLHLWFAYPKLSGALASDLSRDRGWASLSERNYLPVAQVAIDPDWSALRFRVRAKAAKIIRRFERLRMCRPHDKVASIHRSVRSRANNGAGRIYFARVEWPA